MVAAVGDQRDINLSKITPTSWPESCPSKYEESILTIVCGNTHLQWALHEGVGKEFMPHLFWRTPTLSSDEIRTGDPCEILQRFVPQGDAQSLIFGPGENVALNKQQAAKASAERRIPALGIYIVSTNRENEAGIEFLFRDICCRMHSFQASDFFSAEQGVYEGMGIDRLANLKAAAGYYNYPVMVIDGGTALTYTAADKNGNVIGGGIAPGLNSMLRSLHENTGALPLISHREFHQVIEEAESTKTPLPTFARDTKKAIIVAALTGLAKLCWCALKTFKASCVDGSDDATENGDGKDKRAIVCITGGDGDVIAKLLETDHTSLIPMEPGSTNNRDGFKILKHKHLQHYGIAAVLKERSKESETMQSEDDKIRAELVGQRVAKKFRVRSEDLTYRGSVAAVTSGKSLEDDWFYIRYDDSDTEHLSIEGLYDALLLYKEIGEDHMSSEKSEQKKAEATQAAEMLVQNSASVRKHVETPASERRGHGNRKRGAGSLKGAPAGKVPKTSAKKRAEDPHSFVGMRVAKYFGEDVYFGTIQKYIPPANPKDDDLWHVLYDDKDEEDYDNKDLRKGLQVHKKHSAEDPKSRVTAVTAAPPDDDGKGAEIPEAIAVDADAPMATENGTAP